MRRIELNRREVIVGGSVAFLTLSGCIDSGGGDGGDNGGNSSQPGFSESFEGGFGWNKDFDLPDDPNTDDPDDKVDWSIERSDERASTGSWSLKYFLDGSQDDGTIWATRTIDVEEKQYLGSVDVEAWSASESFNTLAYLVLYLGPNPPKDESSFPSPNETVTEGDFGGMKQTLNQAEGWQNHSFEWQTPNLSSDQIHFAVGISAVWETEMTYFVDDVEVSFEPV